MRDIEEVKRHFPAIEFNEYYDKVFSIIQNTDAFLNILGEAGSGKSCLLRVLKYALSDKNVIVCATTGVASSLLNSDYPDIKAVTLHSAFKIKPQDIYGTGSVGYEYVSEETATLIRSMDYLIIDECSMLSCSLFDYLIEKIRYVRAKVQLDLPRIILFGDIMQLPPVIKNDNVIKKYYNETYDGNHYYFNSSTFLDRNFVTVCLKKNYRQNKDENFKDILNRVRTGDVTDKDLKTLNSRVIDDCEWMVDHENSLRMCTTVKDVALYNKVALDMIDSKPVYFHAFITGNFCMTQEYRSGNYPDVIELKVGCPVMITKNDTSDDREFVNGDMGILLECDTESRKVKVLLSNGDEERIVEVPDFRTEVYEYNTDNKDENGRAIVEATVVGTYTNIAVKVCASSTVHKCQGLTIKGYGYFDKGRPNGWVPESGIYVALSRFQSLDHVGLAFPITRSDIKVNKEAIEFLKKVEAEDAEI